MSDEQQTVYERVLLPTRGRPYDKCLGFDDGVYVRPMKVKEFKGLLNSPNEYNLNFIINNCIRGCDGFDVREFVYKDKELILSRIIACSGMNDTSFEVKCEKCGSSYSVSGDLNRFDVSYLDEDTEYPFSFNLPESNLEVKIGLPTDKDIEWILIEGKEPSFNGNKAMLVYSSTAMICSILSCEKEEFKDYDEKKRFYESLSPVDSGYIEYVFSSIDIGLKPIVNAKCPGCSFVSRLLYPVDLSVLCGDSTTERGAKQNYMTFKSMIQKELDLCEYGHIDFASLENMYFFEFEGIYVILSDRLKKRNEEQEKQIRDMKAKTSKKR